jgi:hypothetical protein
MGPVEADHQQKADSDSFERQRQQGQRRWSKSLWLSLCVGAPAPAVVACALKPIEVDLQQRAHLEHFLERTLRRTLACQQTPSNNISKWPLRARAYLCMGQCARVCQWPKRREAATHTHPAGSRTFFSFCSVCESQSKRKTHEFSLSRKLKTLGNFSFFHFLFEIQQ